jgi:hypothetical protein
VAARAGEPRVEIDAVELLPIRPDRLLDRGIDEPRAGEPTANDVYSLRVGGWAKASEQPVTQFELVHKGAVLETAPPLPAFGDPRGARLQLAVSTLDLPYAFRVAVRAVFADDTRSRIAAIAGRRAPLTAGPVNGPSPVLITTIGRSGSTAVSNLLCHHRDLAGYRTWDTETRMVAYWTSVLRGLARPASYEAQLQQPGGMGPGYWWVGHSPHPSLVSDEPVLPALGREAVEGVAAFCRSQIGLVGSAFAAAAGKPRARYLVEKAPPGFPRSVAEVSEELDPRTREIVLVRDFRDTVCSMLAYTRKMGVRGFGPQPDASVQDSIRWMGEVGAKGLAGYVERRGTGAHVLRYEDVVRQPEATLTRLLEYIGADAAPQTVADMLARLEADRERREAHATTDSTQRSVGRWRRELDADHQALAEELLRPQLDAFGYE